MSGLTVERLAELRRIAEAATPGPWEWLMSKDGRILDLITLETGHNEDIITPSHINAWLQVKDGVKDFIPAFDPTTALELLDALAAARAEAERWQARYETLRAGVERVVQDLHELTRATARDWRSDKFSPQLIAAAPAMLDAIEDILADCDAQDDDPEDYRARYYDLHVGHVQRLREIVVDIYPDK